MECYIPKGCCTFRTIKEDLSDDFKNFFSGRAITRDNVAKFFDKFGHMIATRIVFGGKLTSQTTYTKSQLQNVDKSKIEGRIAAALNTYMVSAKGGYAGGKSNEERTASSEVHETSKITNVGGIPEKANDAAEWLESLADDPSYWQPIKILAYKSTLDFLDERIKKKILSLMEPSKPLKVQITLEPETVSETFEFETGLYKITNLNTGGPILDGVQRETASLGIFGLVKTKAGYLIHNPKPKLMEGSFLSDDPAGNFVGNSKPKTLFDSTFWVIDRDPKNFEAGYRIRNSQSGNFLSENIIQSPGVQSKTKSISKIEISKIPENCIRWKFELANLPYMNSRAEMQFLYLYEGLLKKQIENAQNA